MCFPHGFSRLATVVKADLSVGAGFFVGSGGALRKGGPASLLICFSIIGVMMFNTGMAVSMTLGTRNC